MQPLVFHPLTQYNQGQVNNAQGSYNQDVGQAQGAQQNLQNYQQNMQGGTQMYGEQLGQARSQLGFNPEELANAQKSLATTQTTMANLPQAVQQQGGGYGVTAGGMANNMSQMAGNLQGLLAGQTNQVGALKDINQQTLGQAQSATQAGQQGQQLQLTALNQLYSNAADMRDQAMKNMQFLEQAYQDQGQFNVQQTADYQRANIQLAQANATIAQATAQTRQINLQNAAMQQAQQYQMNPNSTGGFNFFGPGNSPITVQQYNARMGTNINPAIGHAATAPTVPASNQRALMGQLGYGG